MMWGDAASSTGRPAPRISPLDVSIKPVSPGSVTELARINESWRLSEWMGRRRPGRMPVTWPDTPWGGGLTAVGRDI